MLVVTDDLMDLTLEGATLLRHGFFTLAVDKAQEKLKKFQLPDPAFYLAQIIQALLASGASSIDIVTEDNTVIYHFDGPGYTEEELSHITDAVFESGKDRSRDRLRELALGLLSVQGLKPRDVSITSNGKRWSKSASLQPVPTHEHGQQMVKVVHRKGGLREPKIIRQVCQSCQADIRLNGSPITSRGDRTTSCPWPNFAFSSEEFQGAFGLAYGELPGTSLVLTRYGVVFSRRQENRIQPPLLVEMEHMRLRKNASQSDVVEDQNYTEMLSDLQAIQLRFAVDLAGKRIPPYQVDQVFTYLQLVAVQNLTHDLLATPVEALSPLERDLLGAALFRGLGNRRYSAHDLWERCQQDGGLLFCPESSVRFSWGEAPVLFCSGAVAQTFRGLFGKLVQTSVDVQTCTLKWNEMRQQVGLILPAPLVEGSVRVGETTFRIFLPDCRAEGSAVGYQGEGFQVVNRQNLGPSPLGFSLVCRQRLRFTGDSLQRLIDSQVEPLYQKLLVMLDRGEVPASSRLGALSHICHYLSWKSKSLEAALADPTWEGLSWLSTMDGARVSLADLRAWLEVYPTVVVAYSKASGTDAALRVQPELLEALRKLLGEERVCLASLESPHFLARSQQVGLSGAALAGVAQVLVVDEDEELADIRRQLEAERDPSQAVPSADGELDEDAVMASLGLKSPGLKRLAGPVANDDQGDSEFAQRCLQATKKLGTRWLSRIDLFKAQGQVFAYDGALPAPLQPNRLLVKIADNDPVAYDTTELGLAGWAYIPPFWEPSELVEPSLLRADSEPSQPGESWPYPELPFTTGLSHLDAELVWSLRRTFKFAAQKLARDADPATLVLWRKRLIPYLSWDRHWALSLADSWFWKVSLLSDASGRERTLAYWRDLPGTLFAVGMEPGRAEQPEATARVLPPWTAQKLTELLQRPVEAARRVEISERDGQLMLELKQKLLATCQQAQCPLEPQWLDQLGYGRPTRWIGGPRKYFIEYDPRDESTRINPASQLIQQLLDKPGAWGERVPVLASAVYTAINRGLAEVEDGHELAYLRAMLDQL